MKFVRLIVPLAVLALVVVAAITIFGGGDTKTLTAKFPRTISIYQGSDVRVLGVPVGKVDSVKPEGTDVLVTMSYDAKVKIPATAQAVIVSPSIVGDRFVQLTPVYTSGPVMADHAQLGLDKTGVPLELDQIYRSMDDLTVALGPTGANKNGALSDLLASAAKNWGGQGASFHTTVQNLGTFTKTLDDNKEQFFGTARELQAFLHVLAQNDQTVRGFNTSLSNISNVLRDERGDLASSLHNLGIAMDQVNSFVKDNKDLLSRNIKGLNRVAKVLVHQRNNLDEILRVAPLALNNLALTYNPQAGTLDTRANLGEIVNQISSDPATLLCGFIGQADPSGSACSQIKKLLPRTPFARPASRQSMPQSDPTLGGLVEVQR